MPVRCPRCGCTTVNETRASVPVPFLGWSCPSCGNDQGDEDDAHDDPICVEVDEALASLGERPQRFATWLGPLPVRAPPHRSMTSRATLVERRLLEAIYAEPDTVEARLVYGDWLLEHGDPRGQLIAMQCAGAEYDLRAAQELVDEHWSAWLGAPAEIVAPGGVAFDRGMWSACEMFDPRRLDEIAQHPEWLEAPSWSTVRRVALPAALQPYATRLIEGPLSRGLHSLRLATNELFALIAGGGAPLAIRELALDDERGITPDLLALDRLPHLEHLSLDCRDSAITPWITFAAAAGIRAMTLRVGAGAPALDEALRHAEGRLERLTFRGVPGVWLHATADATGALKIRNVEVRTASNANVGLGVRCACDDLRALAGRVADDVRINVPRIDTAIQSLADLLQRRIVLSPRGSELYVSPAAWMAQAKSPAATAART